MKNYNQLAKSEQERIDKKAREIVKELFGGYSILQIEALGEKMIDMCEKQLLKIHPDWR